MKRILLLLTASFAVIVMAFTSAVQEEGMYPLAQLGSLDLQKAGLEIPQSEIYEPGKVGLTNALVQLGGCTGSFISEEGLIITNHHCVFSAVAAASTPEKNYLDNGFYAATNDEEIKTSIPCRITLSFDDVSKQVLDGVTSALSAEEQQEKITENIEAITEAEEEKYPDLEIKISEMFVGKYYTLFRYKLLDDVRLVYVPPKAVGKFGGETDNWMWPRHNADFSIVRAYENGKPYKPERHLKIDANGTKENDFVFILGYPGRTYRHFPAQYLIYQNDHLLPVISEWFGEQIELMHQDAAGDKAKQLQYAGRIASLSNTEKNFRGKLQGLRRTTILEDRYANQAKLQEYAKANMTDYAEVIPRIEELYQRKNSIADDFILLNQLYGNSGVLSAANARNALYNEYASLDGPGKKQWLTDEEGMRTSVRGGYNWRTWNLEKRFTAALIYRIGKTGNGTMNEVYDIMGLENPSKSDVYKTVSEIWEASKYADRDKMIKKLDKSVVSFIKVKDKTQAIAKALAPKIDEMSSEWRAISAELSTLMPKLADIKQAYQDDQFVPDANSTLRLTYGHVKGYSPADAVYNDPYTTLDGIIEKAQSEGDYYMPENILKKYKTVTANDNLKHPTKDQVVVGMLYNLDTTGGNSGSPILNAKGELVGVNFDRAFSATINDFEWNESYSRSIGVDIRYVLYVMKYINEADAVLDELGVEL